MIGGAIAAALLAGAVADSGALTVRGDRLFVPARINGVAVEAVLDSGAEATVLDDGFAARIGAKGGTEAVAHGSGGRAEARLIDGARIEAAGLALDGRTIAVLDLDDVGARLFGRPIDAIVGRELFDAARLAIDIEGGTIAVLPDAAAPAGVRLPLETAHGIETLPLSIEGGPELRAEFDLGNGSDMSIGRAAAKRLGLTKPGRIVAREKGGGIGGAVTRDVVVLKTVTLAGVTFGNVRATIDDQPNAADANVGVKLLRRFRIVTDFPNRAVWLAARDTAAR